MEQGLTLEQCLNKTGITADQMEDSEAVVTGEQELKVIENLVQGLPDAEGLGVQAGMRYQITTFGIWAFAMLSSSTVREAIEVGIKFTALSFVLMKFSFVEDDIEGKIIMDIDGIPEHLRQFVLERHMTIFYMLSKETLGDQLTQPRRISLTASSLPYQNQLEGFAGDWLQLNASENAIVLTKETLDKPLAKANPATAAFCIQQCEALLDQRKKQQGFAGEVRSFLLEDIANMPSLDTTAEHFHLSPRTFRRRLDDEQTSFRQLLDDIREGVAIELLSTAGLSVESVAERLGYAETSSFIHAFTRWTGKTPGQYRRKG